MIVNQSKNKINYKYEVIKMNQFICYPKCSTCQKARKWLDTHKIAYTIRDIKTDKLNKEELRCILVNSKLPIKKLFNTHGQLYQEMKLKDKLIDMNEEEQLALLASDGMLVKRPILINENKIIVGFKEDDYKKLL